MAIQSHSNVLELGLPKNGRPPKMRVSDAGQAVSIVQTLIDANSDRAKVDAHVKGMLDGNPPFSPEKLRATGQANRCNVNFREGEAILQAALTPYYDLFAEATYYFNVKCEYGNSSERWLYSQIVTEEFDRTLKLWDGFDYNMQLAIHEFGAYGRGFLFWPDGTNWQPDAVRQSRVLVPDGSPSSLEKQEIIVVLENFLIHKLWRYIAAENASKEAGWNRESVLFEIANAVPEDSGTGTQTLDYELCQQRLRNNDLYESIRSDVVKAAHVFVKEFDGSVSHLIVPRRDGTNTTTKGSPGDVKFLYKKQSRFKSFRQVLAPVFFDIGDGTWHSIKGLLIKIYPFIELKNRLKCSAADNGFLRASVLIQPKTANVSQRMSLIQVGPMTLLPPSSEYDLPQVQLGGSIEETLLLDRAFDNQLSSNIGMYRPTVRKEQGNPETATKVLADQAKEAMLNKGAVNRWYSQMDFVGEEIFRRMANTKLNEDGGANDAALDFQSRCKERGVPSTALKKVVVRSFRNIGNGSIFMRKQAITELLPWAGLMPEAGKQALLDDTIAITANQDFVARYNPKRELETATADERAYAMLENGVIKSGAPVVRTGTQNDVIHAGTHLEAGAQAAASLQQGANPAEVAAYLDGIGQHTAQHLQPLSGNPARKQEFTLLQKQWQELAKIADGLNKMLMQQAQEQEQRQADANQMMSDQDLARTKMEMDAQRKDEKQAQDMRRKDIATRQKLVINDAMAANKINNSNRESTRMAQ